MSFTEQTSGCSDELVILFLNSILTRSFSLGKPYITRKIYLSSFHKKNRFVISNFLNWDMCHLLNKRQVASSDELVILFLNSVLTHSFSLGKPYITRKIYLSSFHKKNRFVISNFLDWDMCHLLNKRQAANSDELVILFLNSVLTYSFSLGKPYITRKIYLFSFHKKNRFVISNFLEWDMCHLLNKRQADSSDEFSDFCSMND